MLNWRSLVVSFAVLGTCFVPRGGEARVEGEPHRLYAEHRLFGGVVVTGNTLTTQSVVAPQVNSVLLQQSAGDIRDVPFDAELEGAYLFWSGSLDGNADRTVDLTAADGTRFNDVAADRCVTVDALDGFFYCRADVTARLRERAGPNQFNGTYVVGDMRASVGRLRQNGSCIDRTCQAKYAAWSLVLVYRSATARTLRDIFIHDGFRHLDEDETTPGVDRFTIEGFDFPEGGRADLSFFGLEGDSFLGVPPQDTDPIIPCDTCFDYMAFGGEKLSDALNPANNLFNSSSPGGFTLGMDLDRFNVSDRLRVGQERVEIEVGSGDGVVNRFNPEPTGGGESFFLGYVMLSVDRNSPNFTRDGTELTVIPDAGAPNERVVITMRITNEGTRDAPNTRVSLSLPDGLTYLPDSFRVDGDNAAAGAEVQNPLAGGFNLGNIPFRGDNDRVIVFRATVDPDARAGSRLRLVGQINSDNLEEPIQTPEAIFTVLGALDLDGISKTVVDGNGDGRFEPGEVATYRLQISNSNQRAVSGIRVLDQLPPYVDVLQAFSSTGEDVSDLVSKRVEFVNMTVPPGDNTATITIVIRIHDDEQLAADGVPAVNINGFAIDNQGTMFTGQRQVETTDPNPWPGAPNGVTRFELTSELDIGSALTRKTVRDLNDGATEPGDTLEYTVSVANTGTRRARVFLDDALPGGLTGCEVTSEHPELACENGRRLRGFLEVDANRTERVIFRSTVDADAANALVIQNLVVLTVGQQRVERQSEALIVEAAADLTGTTKIAVGAVDGFVAPGQVFEYQISVPNTGNRAAANVVLSDPLPIRFSRVLPSDGGRYDPASNQVTWQLGALEAQGERIVRVAVEVPAGLADGQILSNQATVLADGVGATLSDDPSTDVADDATQVRIRSQAILDVSKDVQPREAQPGDEVSYRITITNSGSDAARNLTVQDTVPPDIFSSLSPDNGRTVGNTVTWTAETTPQLAILAPNEAVTLTLRARLVGVLDDGLTIENQARVNAGFGDVLSDDPSTAPLQDPTVLTVRSSPALVFQKTVLDLNGGDPQPGDRVAYTLTVSNRGNGAALALDISDPVPEGLIQVVPSDGGVVSNGRIVWPQRARLEVGAAPIQVRFEATLAGDLVAGQEIANQAEANRRGQRLAVSDDPNTPEPDDPTVLRIVARPDLSGAIKTVSLREAEPGERVSWVVQVANRGTVPATNVVIEDPLPTEFVRDIQIDRGQVNNGRSRTVFDSVPAGTAVAVEITGFIRDGVPDGTNVTNQAFISAAGVEPAPTDDPDTNIADDATTLVVRATPELSLTKAVVDENGLPARPGDVLRYAIVAENSGSGPAVGVEINDPLPETTSLLDAGDGELVGDQVVWRIGEIPPGTRVERVLRLRLQASLENGTNVDNQAQLSAENLDIPVLSDDPATPVLADPTRTQVVSAADFSSATKTARDLDGGPLRPGDRIEYSIRIENTGDAPARNTRIIDELTDELVFIESEGALVEDQRITWNIGEMAPGASETVVLVAEVVSPLANGTVVSNQAQITADSFAAPFLTDDPRTDALDDATSVPVVSAANLEIEKTVAPTVAGGFIAGEFVEYTLTIRNEGDAPSRPTVIDDELSAALSELSTAPPMQVTGRTVRWRVPPVVPGESQSLLVRARLNADTQDGVTVRNRVALGSSTANAEFVVVNRPSVAASTKIVNVENPIPGAQVVYAIDVVNDGAQSARDLQIEDLMPAELTFIGAAPPAEIDGRTVRWTLDELDPGETTRLTLTAQIRNEIEDGTAINNQAFITGAGVERTPTDDPSTEALDDPTSFLVQSRPVLVLDKTVSDDNGGSFAPGDPVSYTLTVRNEGAGPAVDLIVEDVVPENLEGALVVEGQLEDGIARWSLDRVAPGEEVELVLRGRIRPETGNGDEVINRFTVRAANAPLIESPDARLVVETGAVTVAKSVRSLGTGLAPGSEVEFVIRITNERATGVSNITVADPIEDPLLVDVRPLDGGVDLGDGRIEWTPDTTNALRFIPAEAFVEVRVRARIAEGASGGDQITNRAIVGVRGDPSQDEDVLTFEVVEAPNYTIRKSVEADRTQPGDIVEYRIEVENSGGSSGDALRLFDTLPDGLTYIQDSARIDGRLAPDVDGRLPTEDGLNLTRGVPPEPFSPGARVAVTFQARIDGDVSPNTRLENVARVEDSTGTFAEDRAVFEVDGRPDVSGLVKTFELPEGRDGRAQVGDVIQWRLTLTNDGDGSALNLRVSDEIEGQHQYVPGTLLYQGRPATDALDDDRAEAVDGIIRLRLDVLEPGGSIDLRFQTIVTDGPAVENQAFVDADGVEPEPSDDGGEDRNSVTRIEVGERPQAAWVVNKTLLSETPSPVGTPIAFGLSIENTGNVDLRDIEIVDYLPPEFQFIELEDPTGNAVVDTDNETSAGGRQPVRITGLILAPETQVELKIFVAAPLGKVDEGTYCNEAEFSSERIEPERRESCIDLYLDTGRLTGSVFEDLNDDGAFSVDEDLPYSRAIVRVFRIDFDAEEPDAIAEADDEGRFNFSELAVGRYRIEVVSPEGAVLNEPQDIQIDGQDTTVENIFIQPTGRIYDSVSGELIDGARVWIYEDLDGNGDPLDAASGEKLVLVSESDFEHPSHQGQRTSLGGVYRFRIQREGRFVIKVTAPGINLLSPSLLNPPESGFATTQDPDLRIVEQPIPLSHHQADRRYFLAVSQDSMVRAYRNNHIPLDPLASLIDLTKRVDRPSAYVGDIVSFEITVVNRSPEDILYDARTDSGGVWVQDLMPQGLKYVAGSTVLTRLIDGDETPLESSDPDGVRILKFGSRGNGATLQPLDLHAGEALRLKYQAVVDASAEPMKTYKNRAQLLAQGGIPISAVADAKIRILADPDFDQGLLLGRVFCDENRNGVLDPNERGLAGAELFMDHGWTSSTDARGRFHFKDINPGTHGVKLDRRSLLPGSEFTTDEMRVIHFTRGLPARVTFGVTCPHETVSGETSEVTDEGVAMLLQEWGLEEVELEVNRQGNAVVIGQRQIRLEPIALEIDPKSVAGDSLILRPIVPGMLKFSSWQVLVRDAGGRTAVIASGTKLLPRIEWKPSALFRDGPIRFQLELTDGEKRGWGSPWVSWSTADQGALEPLRVVLPGDGFKKGNALESDFKQSLDSVVEQLENTPGAIQVRVHFDNSRGPFSSRSMTRRRAEAIRTYLIKKGIDGKRITSFGMGGSEPLRSNMTARGRRINRRVEILVGQDDAEQVGTSEEIERTVTEGEASVQETELPKRDVVSLQVGLNSTLIPEDNSLQSVVVSATRPNPIRLSHSDGRYARVIYRHPKGNQSFGARSQQVVEGRVGAVFVLGKTEIARPRLTLTPQETTGSNVRRWNVSAPPGGLRWVWMVFDAQGRTLHRQEGTGIPPSVLEWTPKTKESSDSASVQLTLVGPRQIIQTPLVSIDDQKKTRSASQDRLVLDGQLAQLDSGHFKADFEHRDRAPLVVDYVDGDGRWLLAIPFSWSDDLGRSATEPTLPGSALPGSALPGSSLPGSALPASALPGSGLPGDAVIEGDTNGIQAGLGTSSAMPSVSGAMDTSMADSTSAPAGLSTTSTISSAGLASSAESLLAAEQGVRTTPRPENLTLLRLLDPTMRQEADEERLGLDVEFPKTGAPMGSDTLPIRGTTQPGWTVEVNGESMSVDLDGVFGGLVKLSPGQNTVKVVAKDPQGGMATVERIVDVPASSWFLMVLSEGLGGTEGSELDGVREHTHIDVADRVYLHGRAVGWLRGYAKGEDILGGVFKKYTVDVHVDTARRGEYEEDFKQLIDPNRYYPVYGDESQGAKPINTRGPLYVLVEADNSRITVGNFTTTLKGIELFRYDRTHYGAQAEVDIQSGEWRHQLTTFGTDDEQDQQHAMVEFRGTGGSLFYLPHRFVIEGSERIYLVERDRLSGMELRRTGLARDQDYRIRYDDGRILFNQPISSGVFGVLGATQPGLDLGPLGGHPVFVLVEYDHEDPTATGEASMGVHARETYGGGISVGAGVVKADHASAGRTDHILWGTDLQLRTGRMTHLDVEFAESQGQGGTYLASQDGGLTFTPFHRRDTVDETGLSFLLRGGFEWADLTESEEDVWYSEGYYQYISSGFAAGANIQQQGLEKYGGLSRANLGGGHYLHIRHDGWIAEEPETQSLGVVPAFERQVSRLGYGYVEEGLKLDSEFVWTQNDLGPTEPVLTIGALAVGAAIDLDEEWTLLAQQEAVVLGDRRIHQDTSDLFTTTLGARYQVASSLYVEALETVRFNGDNATIAGVRTSIDERHTLYVQERFSQVSSEKSATTVVGGEERFGDDQSGRAYGEYHLDNGAFGVQNRTAVGIGQNALLTPELALSMGYERSQSEGDLGMGMSRDAVSTGVAWKPSKRYALSTRFEFRFEDYDDPEETESAQRDRWQIVSLNNVTVKLNLDWTLASHVHYSHTYDIPFEATEAEMLEGSFGLAYRPVHTDWFVFLFKYSKRYEQRPIDVSTELPIREENDVISLVPILELPYGFQLVEKLALRRVGLRSGEHPTTVGYLILWINRLNYHLTDEWDLGVEYRSLWSTLAKNKQAGALAELNYIIQKTMRLGVGYNFTQFSDEEFAELNETYGGPFFRIMANY